ncbi:MAG: PEP-CTERM sorting domain-containing protein [Desulfobulbaceae bacterium]|nr:PEP-CTERM sorting domain-containing protein [Desulfobulbaceae bacterium]
MGTLITPIWSDPVGGMPANTITYDFDQLNGSIAPGGNIIPGSLNTLPTLEAYLRNGNNFSFGFDPDCHYYNDKVTFTITVDNVSVPEPATLLLFGTGLAGLMGLRRWKFR